MTTLLFVGQVVSQYIKLTQVSNEQAGRENADKHMCEPVVRTTNGIIHRKNKAVFTYVEEIFKHIYLYMSGVT